MASAALKGLTKFANPANLKTLADTASKQSGKISSITDKINTASSLIPPGGPSAGPPTGETNTDADPQKKLQEGLLNAIQKVPSFNLSSLWESNEYYNPLNKFKKEIKQVFKRVKEKTCQLTNQPDFSKLILDAITTTILTHIHKNMHFFDKVKENPDASIIPAKEDAFFYQMYDNLFKLLLSVDNPEGHLFIIKQCTLLLYEIEENSDETNTTEEHKNDNERARKEWLESFVPRVVSNVLFVEAFTNIPEFSEKMTKNAEFLKKIVEKNNSNGENEFTAELIKYLNSTDNADINHLKTLDDFIAKIEDIRVSVKIEEQSGGNMGGIPLPIPSLASVGKIPGSKNLLSSAKLPTLTTIKDTISKIPIAKDADVKGAIGSLVKTPADNGDVKKDEKIVIPNVEHGDVVKFPDNAGYFNLNLIKSEIKDTLVKIEEKICEIMNRKEFHKLLKETIFNDIESNIRLHSSFFKPIDIDNAEIKIENLFFYYSYTILFNLLLKYKNANVYKYITDYCGKIVDNLKEIKDKKDSELSNKQKTQRNNQRLWLNDFSREVVMKNTLFMNEVFKNDSFCSMLFYNPFFAKYALEGTFLQNLRDYWATENYSAERHADENQKRVEEDAKALADEGVIEDPAVIEQMNTMKKEAQDKLNSRKKQFLVFIDNLRTRLQSVRNTARQPPQGGTILSGGKDELDPLSIAVALSNSMTPIGKNVSDTVGKATEKKATEKITTEKIPTEKIAEEDNALKNNPSIDKNTAKEVIDKIPVAKKEDGGPLYNSTEIGIFQKTDNCPDDIMKMIGVKGLTKEDNNPVIKRIVQKYIQDSEIGVKFQDFFIKHIQLFGSSSVEKMYEETKAKDFAMIYQLTEYFKQNRPNPDSEDNQEHLVIKITQPGNKEELVAYIASKTNGYRILLNCILKNKKLRNSRLFLFRNMFAKMSAEDVSAFLFKRKYKNSLNCEGILDEIRKIKTKVGGDDPAELKKREKATEGKIDKNLDKPVEEKATDKNLDKPQENQQKPQKSAIEKNLDKLESRLWEGTKQISNLPETLHKLNKKKIVIADKACSPELTELFEKHATVESGEHPIDATILKQMITHFISGKKIVTLFEKDVLGKMSLTTAETDNIVKRLMVLLLKPGQPIGNIQGIIQDEKTEIIFNKIFSKLEPFDSRSAILSVYDKLSKQPIMSTKGSLFVEIMNDFYEGYENQTKMRDFLNEVVIELIQTRREEDKALIDSIEKVCSSTKTPTDSSLTNIPQPPQKTGGFAPPTKKNKEQTKRLYPTSKAKNKTYRRRFRGQRL